MDCSIIINNDTGETAEVVTQKEVKARKNHFCGECGRVIEKDEIYERYRGYWSDLGWQEHKTCIDCLSIRKAFFKSFIFGCLYEDLLEHIENTSGAISEDCVNMLTKKAKEKVFSFIDRYMEN